MSNPVGWLYQICVKAGEKSVYCSLHVGIELVYPQIHGLSPLHTNLKERDKRNMWLHYRAVVRLSNQLSTAGGTQHVLCWYAVGSAPNTLLANLEEFEPGDS